MSEIRKKVDVCVVGAGHAGCEAALACARLGLETVIFTVSVESIALMPCNPNIGGSSKGHLVLECGHTQAPAIAEILTDAGAREARILTDLSGKERIVVAAPAFS